MPPIHDIKSQAPSIFLLCHLNAWFSFLWSQDGGYTPSPISMFLRTGRWTSPVAQWLRICLPIQVTRVRFLLWEDTTCQGATKPVCPNYWVHVLETESFNYWSPCTLRLCSTTKGATAMGSLCIAMKSNPRLPHLEKAHMQQRRPRAAKNK